MTKAFKAINSQANHFIKQPHAKYAATKKEALQKLLFAVTPEGGKKISDFVDSVIRAKKMVETAMDALKHATVFKKAELRAGYNFNGKADLFIGQYNVPINTLPHGHGAFYIPGITKDVIDSFTDDGLISVDMIDTSGGYADYSGEKLYGLIDRGDYCERPLGNNSYEKIPKEDANSKLVHHADGSYTRVSKNKITYYSLTDKGVEEIEQYAKNRSLSKQISKLAKDHPGILTWIVGGFKYILNYFNR